MLRKTWFLILLSVLSILVLAACGSQDDESEKENEENNEQENVSPELPEPDLEGIPEIVANINGEEITREEFETTYQQQFQQIAMQSQIMGEEVNQDELKEQIAEGLVGQKLLSQEANNRFPDVSEESINKIMDQILEQNGMETEDELFAAFEQEGMEKEEVMSLIETEVRVDQLIAEEAGDIEPTEKELESAYEMIKAQQEQLGGDEEVPSFEELKPHLVEQVKYQKETEVMQTLVANLREEADVTIYL